MSQSADATDSQHAEGKTSAPLWDQAYGRIKFAIIQGHLPAGSQVTEQGIASELRISRTPVHQAIVRLEQEGWVRLQPKRGVLVSPVTVAEMRDIYEILLVLEGAAVERLASRAPDRDDGIDAALAEAAKGADEALRKHDLEEWAALDLAFHTLLVERSGNPYLTSFANAVIEKSHRARMMTLSLRKPPEASNRDHRAIIEAIVQRKPQAARQALNDHRQRGMHDLLPILEDLSSRQMFGRR